MEIMEGKPISEGSAAGFAVVHSEELRRPSTQTLTAIDHLVTKAHVLSDCVRMDEALKSSEQDIQALMPDSSNQTSFASSLELLNGHLLLARDIASQVKESISKDLVGVEDALAFVIRDTIACLVAIEDEIISERETDVRDIGRRLTRHLFGLPTKGFEGIETGSIVIAKELVPSQVISLAQAGIAGMVTEIGGNLGHTAIIARSLGIPAVSGIPNVTARICSGMVLLIDGTAGTVIVEPSEHEQSSFKVRTSNPTPISQFSGGIREQPCRTVDGTAITLYGNVGLADDLEQVLDKRLAGVGLFRTEFLYLQSKQVPETSSQQTVYEGMATRLGDLPLVIRTFDLGGDKLPPFMLLDAKVDPSVLHLRGLRFSLAEQSLLRSQLRAIVQVAQVADVRILFPMVIGHDDFSQAVQMVEVVVHECNALRRPQVGAMIETPAALFCLDEILELADFITIGTNDLTQYMLAADRELSSSCESVTAFHHAVLRAISHIILTSKRWNCPVCVCGEEAGDPKFAELLIGLGVTEFSISTAKTFELANAIRRIDLSTARVLAKQSLQCRNPQEVQDVLNDENRQKYVNDEVRHSVPYDQE